MVKIYFWKQRQHEKQVERMSVNMVIKSVQPSNCAFNFKLESRNIR